MITFACIEVQVCFYRRTIVSAYVALGAFLFGPLVDIVSTLTVMIATCLGVASTDQFTQARYNDIR